MEKADESVSTCVCVHVPFTTMCVGVRVYVSLKGASEASMSAAKRQNTLRIFLFTTTSTCMNWCVSFRGVSEALLSAAKRHNTLSARLRVCLCARPCFARS